MNYPILYPKIDYYEYKRQWTYPSVCNYLVEVMEYAGSQMNCAGGHLQCRPVRRVGCSLLSIVLWLVDCVCVIFVCKNFPSISFSSLYYMKMNCVMLKTSCVPFSFSRRTLFRGVTFQLDIVLNHRSYMTHYLGETCKWRDYIWLISWA
jgi:hypothetical protein